LLEGILGGTPMIPGHVYISVNTFFSGMPFGPEPPRETPLYVIKARRKDHWIRDRQLRTRWNKFKGKEGMHK
jgi:hypothetical protein